MSPRSASPRSPKRKVAVLVASVAAAVGLLSGCLTSSQQQVLNELNADRKAYALRTLPEHWQAQQKAQAWADKLARERALYHSTLTDGISVRWCSLGENVGYGPNVAAIEDAYMGSAGHRANILASKWNGVGVGYARNGSTVWTVQFFIQTC